MFKFKSILIIIFVLCFFSVFALADGSDSESVQASSMRLMQTEGNVTLTDQNGAKLALRNRMRLYSGCGISTEKESRAGILLDDAKAVTIAESSAAVISQEGKKLEIAVNSGKMFFEVSKPLESDESFEIRTSTMVLGIRGTSGCVEAISDSETLVTLITGHAEITCFAGDVVTIEAGQQVRIVKNTDGSCGDQYVDLTDEYAAEILDNLQWMKEEHHGAIWEAWKELGGLKRSGVGDNQTPVSKNEDSVIEDSVIENIDYPGDDIGPDGPFAYYDPDTGDIHGE